METKGTYYRIKDIVDKIKGQRILFIIKLKEKNGKSESVVTTHTIRARPT